MPQQIAFIGNVRKQAGWNLYTIDAESADLHQITFNTTIDRFAWSPDGQRIAYLSSSYVGEAWTRKVSLHTVDKDGSNQRLLAGEKGGISWNWSPDSKQIAFTCFAEGHQYPPPTSGGELYIANLESGEIHRVTGETVYAVWSQKTNALDFLWSYDSQNVYLMDADGTNRRLLFHVDLPISPFSWSPDGHYLAFNIWSRSHWGASYQDIDGFCLIDKQGKLLFQQREWGASALAWSPDSKQVSMIAYLEDDEGEHLYCVGAMKLDVAKPRFLAESTYEVGLSWSPDSQQIAFVHTSEGSEHALGIINAQGKKNLRCYPMVNTDTTGKLNPDTPTWSPDSLSIAYNSPGMEHLYTIKADGTDPRCLTDGIEQMSSEESEVFRNIVARPTWQP